MCRMKSGLIFKGGVVLAPMYNESHSRLLEKLGIEDTDFNARKVFVRAELLPDDGNLMSDINKWTFVVDQDVTPDWYDEDSGRYEEMFRKEVQEWRKQNIVVICGQPCTKIKEADGNTYYHTCNPIFRCTFGITNNYATSILRQELLDSDFVKALITEYGEQLVPVSMDLTSLDGLKDYDTVTDIVGIPDINFYRECRENILQGDNSWWLSTPDSTPSGIGASGVRYVYGDGDVFWCGCDCSNGVRPFFILSSPISESFD